MAIYKVLPYTDTHCRDSDTETIKGYVKANRLMMKDLEDFIVSEGITHAISAGDLMDKGYRSVLATMNDTARIRSISEALLFNYKKALYTRTDSIIVEEIVQELDYTHYMVMGNHFYHERDSNPEMGFIQPHPTIKPREPVDIDKALIHVPDYFIVGNVQFSLFHWNETGDNFVQDRQPGIKYHIGIYHHENMVPTSIRNKIGLTTKVEDGYLKDTLRNIDFAICGHVHSKGGMVIVEVDGRKVPVMVSGSLALTSTHSGEYHTDIDLPVFIIDDEAGTLKYKMHNFKLHTEMLRMYKDKKINSEGLEVNLENIESKKEYKRKIERKNIDTGLCSSATLEEYLDSKKYTHEDKKAISLLLNRPLEIMEAVRLGVEDI